MIRPGRDARAPKVVVGATLPAASNNSATGASAAPPVRNEPPPSRFTSRNHAFLGLHRLAGRLSNKSTLAFTPLAWEIPVGSRGMVCGSVVSMSLLRTVSPAPRAGSGIVLPDVGLAAEPRQAPERKIGLVLQQRGGGGRASGPHVAAVDEDRLDPGLHERVGDEGAADPAADHERVAGAGRAQGRIGAGLAVEVFPERGAGDEVHGFTRSSAAGVPPAW